MPWSDTAGLSFGWSYHLADALSRNGVRHVFISPGSRSTPITLALTHHPHLICHSVLDERAASFMALGAAKKTGKPAVFVCTSGTAAANAYPAVIEARMSATPLILLTADRPPSSRATGASQTIDQIKMYGDYPVFFFDSGEPVDTPGDFRRLSQLGVQACRYAVDKGGPVHLNLPFRKPLEPTPEQISECVQAYSGQESGAESAMAGTGAEPSTRPHQIPAILPKMPRPVTKAFLKLIAHCERPLVIAGPASNPNSVFFDWCRKNAIPVLCESGGIAGGITRHPLLLSGGAPITELPEPDVILRTGGDPVHRDTLLALKKWKAPQIILGGQYDHSDATLSATHLLAGALDDYDWDALMSESKITPGLHHHISDYRMTWMTCLDTIDERIADALSREHRLTDPHVYQTLLPLIRQSGAEFITLSNSFPVRDYLLYGSSEDVTSLPALVNRGASGIDGVTATAIGSTLAGDGSSVLFTGDLAFLHDISALNNLMQRDLSLKIIVLNNRGGSIFRMLPFPERDDIYTEFIETPQQVDIAGVARAHGLAYACANAPGDLVEAWKRLDAHRIAILECRTSADASMEIRNNAHL